MALNGLCVCGKEIYAYVVSGLWMWKCFHCKVEHRGFKTYSDCIKDFKLWKNENKEFEL